MHAGIQTEDSVSDEAATDEDVTGQAASTDISSDGIDEVSIVSLLHWVNSELCRRFSSF